VEPGREAAAFLGVSLAVTWMLRALLPIIRIGVECAAQLLTLNSAPPWQVAIVEKLAAPLMRSCNFGIWCLAINMLASGLPAEVEPRLVGESAPGGPPARRVLEQAGAFSGHLWMALSLSNLAGYLLSIKESPQHILGEKPSTAGTWAHVVEQYYLALQARDFENESMSDRAAAINRVLTAVIVLAAALPWFSLLGVQLSGVVALGGVGTVAFGFASKEVAENLVSGVLLSISKPFVEGDRIRTEDAKYKGVVRKVGLAYSQINTDDGETLMVPNSIMLKKATVSMTRRRFRVIRGTFPVVLGDFSKLGALCEKIRDRVAQHPDVISGQRFAEMKRQDPKIRIFEPQCTFEGYEARGAAVEVLAYTANIRDPRFMQVRSEVLLAANEQIAQAGGAIGLAAFRVAGPGPEASAAAGESPAPVD